MICHKEELLIETRKVEALLFAAEKPYPSHELKEKLEYPELFDEIILSLKEFYKDSYIDLVDDQGWRFKVDLDKIRKVNEEERRTVSFSETSLIVLSVIAFHQPVSLNDINEFVGVKVNRKVIDRLVKLELITGTQRKYGKGRALVYVTTDEFLKAFNLHSIGDLPTTEQVLSDFKPVRSTIDLD